MITHVIVQLDLPIEEKYWEYDDVSNDEYYGIGKPLVRCKDCKWWKAEKEECVEWYDSPYAPADGYCFRAERKYDD